MVHVEWKDITGRQGWQSRPEAMRGDFMRCSTFGVLLSKSPTKLVVVGTFADQMDQVNDVTVIPRACVTKTTRIGTIRGVR